MTAHTPAGLPETGTWPIDPGHSSARFSVVHHSVATFSAAFYGVSGSYDAVTGRLTGSVEVASLHLPYLTRLKQHLLSDDWFDAPHSPLISFDGECIAQPGGRIGVRGELTIRGQPRSITADATVGGRAPVFDFATKTVVDHFGIDLTTMVDRRDFGLSFNNRLPNGETNLGWKVQLNVALELVEAE